MKVFAGGIVTETNTFSPVMTGIEDFSVLREKDALSERIEHPGLELSVTWRRHAQSRGYEFSLGLMAFAQPGGITVRSAYEVLRDELLRELQCSMPVDVVLLNLHGAMIAQGYDDCEEDLIARVRAIVGRQSVIAVELDLHCHLSLQKICAADVVVTYKEYPHIDVSERAVELFELAMRTRLGEIHPTMALFDCRMIGLYPTTRQPLRGLVDEIIDAERRQGVLSISFGHGFQFADVPDVGAKVLVVSDNDQSLAREVAREFGLKAHALRAQIGFESISMTMEDALSAALSSGRGPVVVADQADNVGGGAPGDSTFALRWLLDHKAEEVALGIVCDPGVVKICKKVGVGAKLPVRLGGKLGPVSGDPLDLEVVVLAMREQYMHPLPQQTGDPWMFPAGDVVALRCGTIDIVVSSERCQCFCPSIFSDLGIDPKRKKILIPKSYQHFYQAFAPIAADVIYMAAPGAVAPDPRENQYHRLNTTNLYPWVKAPVLTTR